MRTRSIDYAEVLEDLRQRQRVLHSAITFFEELVRVGDDLPLVRKVADPAHQNGISTPKKKGPAPKSGEMSVTDALLEAVKERPYRTSIELTDRVQVMCPSVQRSTIQASISYHLASKKISKDENLKVHPVLSGQIVP